MNKHAVRLLDALTEVVRVPGKWEYRFLALLNIRAESQGRSAYALTKIESIALDSILHHYRDQLPDGYHFCTGRCQQYERPEAEPWFQAVLFDKEPFEGEPSLMQHPTAVQLTL